MDEKAAEFARVARDSMMKLVGLGLTPWPETYARVFFELCAERGLSVLAPPSLGAEKTGSTLDPNLIALLVSLSTLPHRTLPSHPGLRALVDWVARLTVPGAALDSTLVSTVVGRVDELSIELAERPPLGSNDLSPDLVKRLVEMIRGLVPVVDPEGQLKELIVPALLGLAVSVSTAQARPHLEAVAQFVAARRKTVGIEFLGQRHLVRRAEELESLTDALLEILGHSLPAIPEIEALITGARIRVPKSDAKGMAELHAELIGELRRVQLALPPMEEQKQVVKSVLKSLADQLAYATSGSVAVESFAVDIQRRLEAADDMSELLRLQELLVRESELAATEAEKMRRQLGVLSSRVSTSQQQIEELEQALVETISAMNLDPLTRLPNRRAMTEWVATTLYPVGRAERDFSLLVLDLDHFKRVNDTFGHLAGDAVLAETGRRVKSGIRVVDLLARFGGEEFVLILPDCELDVAQAVADRMCTLISRKPMGHEGHVIPVTTSVGVAKKRPHEDFNVVFARADQCLYKAKQAGRNRAVAEVELQS